jgi:hypothetical protein
MRAGFLIFTSLFHQDDGLKDYRINQRFQCEWLLFDRT